MSKILILVFLMTNLLQASLWKHFTQGEIANSDKLMLIKVIRDDCQYCCYMNRQVFSDEKLMQTLDSKFTLYTVNVSHESMPFNLKASVVPSFYILDQKHKLLKTIVGAWSKKDFLDFLAPFFKDK